MLGGIALLGALAGTLGAFLRVQDTGGGEQASIDPGADASPVAATELAALRTELAEVNRRLSTLQAHLGITDGAPEAPDDG
jgi:hypothetical protein